MCIRVVLLGLFGRLLAVRLGPVPDTELAFGNRFLVLDYLAHPFCKGRSLVLPQLAVPSSSPWESCPFLNGDMNGDRGGVAGDWVDRSQRREQEKREWNLWSICNINENKC